MKQKDIILIVVVTFISAIVSFFISNALFGGEKGKIEAETVQAISADFPSMDPRYFNTESFNPVKLISISESDNNEPFSASAPEQ